MVDILGVILFPVVFEQMLLSVVVAGPIEAGFIFLLCFIPCMFHPFDVGFVSECETKFPSPLCYDSPSVVSSLGALNPRYIVA